MVMDKKKNIKIPKLESKKDFRNWKDVLIAFFEHKEEAYQLLYEVMPPILLESARMDGSQVSLLSPEIERAFLEDLRTLPGRLTPRIKEEFGDMI